jgi:hypothetical protein
VQVSFVRTGHFSVVNFNKKFSTCATLHLTSCWACTLQNEWHTLHDGRRAGQNSVPVIGSPGGSRSPSPPDHRAPTQSSKLAREKEDQTAERPRARHANQSTSPSRGFPRYSPCQIPRPLLLSSALYTASTSSATQLLHPSTPARTSATSPPLTSLAHSRSAPRHDQTTTAPRASTERLQD